MPIRPAVPLPGPVVYVPRRGPGCFVLVIVVPLIAILVTLGATAVLIALAVVVAIELVRFVTLCVGLWQTRKRN
jgi:hypothetical protein